MIQAYTRDPSALFLSVSHTSTLLPCGREKQPVYYQDATLQPSNDNNMMLKLESSPHHTIAVDWYKGTVTGYLDSNDAINHVPSFTHRLPECPPCDAEQYVRETFEFLRRGHSLYHPECRCRPRRRSHELGFQLWDHNVDEYCTVGTTGQGRSLREIERELGVQSLYGLLMAGGELMPLMQVLVRLAGLQLHTDATTTVLLSSPICCIPPEIITGEHIVAAARALYPRAFVCAETCFGDLARLESAGVLRVIPIMASSVAAVFWRPPDEHLQVDSDIRNLWHETMVPKKTDTPSFFGYATKRKKSAALHTTIVHRYRLLANANNNEDDKNKITSEDPKNCGIDNNNATTEKDDNHNDDDDDEGQPKKKIKRRAPLRLYGSRRH